MQLIHIHDAARQLYLGININLTDVDSENVSFGSILQHAENAIPDFKLYNQKLLNRNNGKYHITVFNVAECGKKSELLTFQNALVKNSSITFKGIGSLQQDSMTTWYVVVESPVLNNLRNNVDLPDKDFHITIAFTDKDLFKGRKNVPNILEIKKYNIL